MTQEENNEGQFKAYLEMLKKDIKWLKRSGNKTIPHLYSSKYTDDSVIARLEREIIKLGCSYKEHRCLEEKPDGNVFYTKVTVINNERRKDES